MLPRRYGTSEIESLLVDVFSEAYHATPFKFDLSNQASLGPEDAAHTLVEFADFRCPHCRTAFKDLVSFVKSRSDVRLVYYFFPLSSFGEVSLQAARAAEAARLQGKFWELSALLYENQMVLSETNIMKYVEAVGLDMGRFKEDYGSEAVQSAVMADRSLGAQVGITGTPAIFIDGRPFGFNDHSTEKLGLRVTMESDRDQCR